jgi:hypothetical protein
MNPPDQPTPRTDKAIYQIFCGGWAAEGEDAVDPDFARQLETQLVRATAELKLLGSACDKLRAAHKMEAKELRARAEKAEADTARLDWLEANPEAIRAYSIHKSTFGRKVWWETGFGNYHTAREAVDAAMKEASE